MKFENIRASNEQNCCYSWKN